MGSWSLEEIRAKATGTSASGSLVANSQCKAAQMQFIDAQRAAEELQDLAAMTGHVKLVRLGRGARCKPARAYHPQGLAAAACIASHATSPKSPDFSGLVSF